MANKIKIDILILIEHRARELESAVLLKYFFEKKGYSVIIDSIKFHKESVVLKYKPKLAIVPWAYGNKEIDLFRNFNRFNNNTIILNMHHEQISNDGSDSFIIPTGDAKKVFHISWGENYSQKLLENNCSHNSIIQCGNPRLDFYKSNLNKISAPKEILSERYNLDSSKRWILFIANSFHLLSENQININISKGVDIKEQIEVSINNRNSFLKYASDYLEVNNDAVFIYRPHPSFAHLDKETLEIKELCSKYRNFRCISENSIRDWIINSDITMSFHSTSVIECAVCDIPFYLFRSHNLSPDKDYKFFNNYEYIISDYNVFIEVVKGENDFNFTKFNENINEYIDLNINKYSAEIIVDRLDEIYHSKCNYDEKIDFKIKSYCSAVLVSYMKKILFMISKIDMFKRIMTKNNDIRFFNLLYSGDDYFDETDIYKVQNQIKDLLDEG